MPLFGFALFLRSGLRFVLTGADDMPPTRRCISDVCRIHGIVPLYARPNGAGSYGQRWPRPRHFYVCVVIPDLVSLGGLVANA